MQPTFIRSRFWLAASLAFSLNSMTADVAVAAKPKAKATAKKDDKKKVDEKKIERPGDQKASSKGLEAVLKKTEEEDRPLAPAKLDGAIGKEVTKDLKADEARQTAINQIQKILPKQKNPDVRADLTFQLAELWWDKSRFVNMTQEMPALAKAMDDWNKCLKEKGEKACGGEPRVNNRLSELYRKNAIDLYSTVIKEYPKYARTDEIRFILAYNMFDLAGGMEGKAREMKQQEALKQYQQLIALHPNSPFVADAYTQLGNAYFESNQLAPARKAFEECSKLQNPKTEAYCIYKLAWCDINSGAPEDAIKRFKNVIARGDAKGEKIKLKQEALRDIVKPFSDIDAFDTAISYFKEKAGAQGGKQYIQQLSNVYFATGKFEMAIKMFRQMLSDYKNDANSPEWQSKIVLSYDKLNKRTNVLEEMRTLVNSYKPGGNWSKINASNKGAIEVALSLTEEALYNLVTDYHQEAIKTKSVPTYRLARDIYHEYVENFPDSDRSYQMRFYYGEILYALEEYQPAFEQYIKVASNPERQDLKPVAAKNMLLSSEKLVDIEAGRYKPTVGESNKTIDEGKDKGGIQKLTVKIEKIDKNAKEIPLTDLEKQLVVSCDKYLEFIPTAPDEAPVRLRAAVIYFDKLNYVEAAKRLGDIINKFPKEATSSKAAGLVLESLEVKEQWKDLNRLSRSFLANKELLEGSGKDEFKKKLAVYIEGSQFKIASDINEVEKNYPEAAKSFRSFVQEFPKSKFSPIALYNSFVIYQRAKELDTAIEMGEKLLVEYPTCDSDEMRKLPGAEGTTEMRPAILPLMIFDLAKVYQDTADFATASKYYEKFATDFPTHNSAPDAQFNAALWYQGLGDYPKAIAAYEKYIKIYQGKKPEEREKLKLVSDETVFYQICLIVELQKDPTKLIAKLDEYQKNYKAAEPWKLLNARYKQLLANNELKKKDEVFKIAEEIVKRADSLPEVDRKKESSKLAIAHSRFITLDPKYQEYVGLKFTAPAKLAADLGAKKKSKEVLEKAYIKVVEDGNGDWAIGALVREAMLPKLFSKALIEAPVPKDLDEDQKELYRAQLEEIALQYEEPAIGALEVAIHKSFELGIYNEWTLEAEQILAEFKPDLFNEIKELPIKGTEFFVTADAASNK